MLLKTQGIVLHHIKYSESSLIVKIYTKKFGLQSYMVKGVRSKKSSLRGSLFQPMTLLNLIVYHRENNNLQHIREAEVAEPFHSISSDLRKSTMAIFLSEILMKAIREGEANIEMFEFLSSSLHLLDMQNEGIENYHLHFLVKLSRHLGFFPQGDHEEAVYFDMREGCFSLHRPQHADHLDSENSVLLSTISRMQAGELSSLNINKNRRNQMLDAILLYYNIHLGGTINFKSLEVLRTVFH